MSLKISFFKILRYIFILLDFVIVKNVTTSLELENVIGGDPSEIHDFPYQVTIERAPDRMCGGGIIDESHVLTAAHCVVDIETNKFLKGGFKVTAGTADLAFPDTEVDVERIYVPSDFMPRELPNSDIAVLKLKEPLTLEGSSKVGKLKIPQTQFSYAGQTAKVAGFGWHWIQVWRDIKTDEVKERGGWFHSHMKHLRVNVLKNHECRTVNEELVITHRHICARSIPRPRLNDEAVCSGDSGSPLVVNDTVIGILSTSPVGCNETEKSSIYTRVSYYKDFIENAKNNIEDKYIRVHKVNESFIGKIIDFIKSHMTSSNKS